MSQDIVLSQTDGRPMYLQIIEKVKERIAVGDWQKGVQLPSIRQLAVSLRISVITVKRAYLELEREGVILTRHGKGSYVAVGSELGPRLHREELEKSLERAAELAILLGLSGEELQQRLRAVHDRQSKEKAQ